MQIIANDSDPESSVQSVSIIDRSKFTRLRRSTILEKESTTASIFVRHIKYSQMLDASRHHEAAGNEGVATLRSMV